MTQANQYDPGYFRHDINHNENPQAPRPVKNKIRKPGLDYGTFLWPILGMFLHVATSTVVMIVWMVGKMILSPSYLQKASEVFENGKTSEIMGLLMGDFIPMAIVYSIVQIILFAVFLIYRNKKEKYYVLKRSGRVGDWVSAIMVTFSCLGLATLWMMLLAMLGERFKMFSEMLEGYNELTESSFAMGDHHPLILTLGLAILVPIAEELLFRGIIMAEMRRVMPSWLAILLNALLFALFHGNPVQGVYVVIAGIGLAAAYVWSESIWVPILMHMIYNFFGSVFVQIVPFDERGMMIFQIIVGVIGVIGLGLFILMFKKRRLPYKKPIPHEIESASLNNAPPYFQ